MTRSELAKKVGLTDTQVKDLFDAIRDEITDGNEVNIFSFGSFKSVDKASRTAKNPKTGETIQVAAKKAVKFSAAKAFKDGLNK